MQSSPLAIGIPVYNGEKYLSACIDSILKQSYSDFEIIICDNNSNDDTQEICLHYKKLDNRIKYFRNLYNLGAANNFNLTFQKSDSDYFKWQAHDDIIEPGFLATCIEELNVNPKCVLSVTKVKHIDKFGNLTREYNVELPNLQSSKAYKRFDDAINIPNSCYHVFGVIRSCCLRKTNLIGSYIGSDRALIAELALHGELVEKSSKFMWIRDHPKRSVRIPLRRRISWYDSTLSNESPLLYWKLLIEYNSLISRTRVKTLESIRCRYSLLKWVKHHRRHLLSDIKYKMFGDKGKF